MAETILDMELLDNGGDLLMETIPGGGGGGGEGTSNYNDLSNKPKINGVTLSGNKTSADLGLQEEIDDLEDIRDGAEKGATAVQPSALDDYQTQAITDEGGYFTDDTVEGALQELGGSLNGVDSALSGILTLIGGNA